MPISVELVGIRHFSVLFQHCSSALPHLMGRHVGAGKNMFYTVLPFYRSTALLLYRFFLQVYSFTGAVNLYESLPAPTCVF